MYGACAIPSTPQGIPRSRRRVPIRIEIGGREDQRVDMVRGCWPRKAELRAGRPSIKENMTSVRTSILSLSPTFDACTRSGKADSIMCTTR